MENTLVTIVQHAGDFQNTSNLQDTAHGVIRNVSALQQPMMVIMNPTVQETTTSDAQTTAEPTIEEEPAWEHEEVRALSLTQVHSGISRQVEI